MIADLLYYGRDLEPQDPNAPTPFDASRLYGDEKYSIQNMLLAGYNAPRTLPKGTTCYSVYSDRAPDAWDAATKGIHSAENADAFWHGVAGKNLMLFARRLARAVGIKGTVTGIRMVRFTDQGGYPVERADIIYKA